MAVGDPYYQAMAGGQSPVGGAAKGATGMVGGLMDKAKGGGLAGYKPWLVLMLVQMGLGHLLKQGHQQRMMGLQTSALEEQAEAQTPESMYYQAMMPEADQESQLAQMLLLSQLGGGNQAPQLASGEERIGGRQRPFQF